MSGFRQHYRASSREDVRALVEAMRALPEADQLACIVAVHVGRLMLPRGILRVALWFVGFKGERGKAAFLLELYKRDPEGVLKLWEQTCDHVLNGRDSEGAGSAGGWSQREINLFLGGLRQLGILEPNPTPSAPLPETGGVS